MKNNFDFHLASCIHDMKNAISLILNSIEQLNTDSQKDTKKHLANLNYEASRLNNDLIHLLGFIVWVAIICMWSSMSTTFGMWYTNSI